MENDKNLSVHLPTNSFNICHFLMETKCPNNLISHGWQQHYMFAYLIILLGSLWEYWKKQQAHSNTSRFTAHKHTLKQNQDTFLTASATDANHQSLRINLRAWECGEEVYVWDGESAHVHACVSSKAVPSCVWWKAPDVACLLMCNKKAQLGQKAREAKGGERRVEWGKEGISLKEIMEGWGQGASLS